MISVVIPNWNGMEWLPSCLTALKHQTQQPDQIVVVDNGSEDNSLELLKRNYPWVEIIALESNHGFAGGVNHGIRSAIEKKADYVAILNNDAKPDPEWLETLLASIFHEPDVAAVAAKQIDREGRIDTTGEAYSIWGTPFSRGRGERDQGQYDTPEQQRVFAVTGGASLYRTRMFQDVGVFDEWLFAYYEDADLCFRARLKGWEFRYEPSAIVHHYVGGTSGRLGDFRLYHLYKNFSVVYAKNMPGKLLWKYGWRVAGVFGVKNLQLLVHVKVVVFARMWLSLVRHAPALIRVRRRIQKNRAVDTSDIDSVLYHAPPPEHAALNTLVAKSPFD